MRRLAALLLVATLATSCTSAALWQAWGGSGAASDGTTIYRSAKSARTVLTALETLRYHSAQAVAKAYVQGRVSKEQAKSFERYDNQFREAWGKASDLVLVWLSSGKPPAGVQQSMSEVESLAASIEKESRGVRNELASACGSDRGTRG